MENTQVLERDKLRFGCECLKRLVFDDDASNGATCGLHISDGGADGVFERLGIAMKVDGDDLFASTRRTIVTTGGEEPIRELFRKFRRACQDDAEVVFLHGEFLS
jgi:hypothetical protein